MMSCEASLSAKQAHWLLTTKHRKHWKLAFSPVQRVLFGPRNLLTFRNAEEGR